MQSEIKRPQCCGECRRYVRDEDNPGMGWCDNWGGVHIPHDGVCHPNFGVKKESEAAR